MDTDHELPPATAEDILWEQERRETLRSFEVVLRRQVGGDHRRAILAHFFNNDNTAGHWYFFTITPAGRQVITHAFGASDVVEVIETTPAAQAYRIDQIIARQHAKHRGKQALATMAQSSRRTH